MEKGNVTYNVAYAADGKRIKSDMRDGNDSFTIRYYGNGLEKAISGVDNIDYLTYLCHGAIVVHHEGNSDGLRSAPPTTPTAILQGYYDAQGSLVALVDENGNVVRRYAYDPWGKRVKPTNWTQPDTSEELYHINRGYTMHEHLDDFELINMNGRVFDPAVAQFLSPDVNIQDPYNWLNYNRYAYGYNNPLTYVDPDGEIAWEILILSALACAALDVVVQVGNNMLLGDMSFNEAINNINWTQVVIVGAVGAIVGSSAEALTVGIERSMLSLLLSPVIQYVSGDNNNSNEDDIPDLYDKRPPVNPNDGKKGQNEYLWSVNR